MNVIKQKSIGTADSVGSGVRSPDYVVDLRHLFRALWWAKYIVLAAAILGFGYGGWKLHQHVPTFEAYLIVAPASSPTDQLTPSAGGLAQRLGISVAAQKETTNFDRMKILFRSYSLAERLQEKYGMMQLLFAGSWDEEAQDWRKPEGRRFNLRERFRKFFNLPTWQAPSLESLASYIGGSITVDKVEETSIRRISFRHPDRDIAVYVLENVYRETDDLVRRQDSLENKQRQIYLTDQLSRVSLTENRLVLIEMLERVERTSMLLDSELPYAGRILEEPRASSRPVAPSVLRIVILPGVGFTLFVAVICLCVYFVRTE